MTATNTQSEEKLVDLLDEALREIRRGKPVDSETWSRTHPELTAEGTCLLETLTQLSSAAEVWTGTSIGDIGTTTNHLDDTERLLPVMIGRYQIRCQVGSGSMGIVYEGYDPQLDRRVAVKVPRCERLAKDRATFVERFIREARAAAAVRHTHVCPVYDVGQHADQPYVVMAFVEGETLEAVLSRGRIEDPRRAVELAAQIAEALEAIHSQGIIHRDLKPGNILIDRAGHGLLTDFGLAVSNVDVERLTSDGLIIGTPVYMSPEQAAGENSTLTPASDIYSLGVVLHEMLTGAVPFRGPLLELLRRIQSETPAPVTTLRPDCDPALSEIALRAMGKLPASRFKSASEMAAALRGWLTNEVQATASDDNHTQPLTVLAENSKSGHRPWRRLPVLALVAASIAVMVWLRSNADSAKQFAPETRQPAGKASAMVISDAPVDTPLTGEFAIMISSDPDKGPITKSRVRVDQHCDHPLRNGELVQFEAHLNRPGYIYLLWVNPDGSVIPIYPWDVEHFKGFDAPRVAGSDRPTDHVFSPSSRKTGLVASDPVGLQTFVMLARREPLANSVDMAQILAHLPRGPKFDERLAHTQPKLRGITAGQTKSLENALYDQIENRLSPHFELIQMMTFPQVQE